MTMHLGPLLTNVGDMDVLDACLATPMFDTLKIVAGWGVNHGWATETRAFALACAPTTIIRTRSGDGCAGHRTLDPQHVLEEIAPWYALKRRIWIEIGNEPNNLPTALGEAEIWGWRYYLMGAIAACRRAFPKAKIIAPAMTQTRGFPSERFYSVCLDAFKLCDAVAVHAYAHKAFDDDGQFTRGMAQAAAAGKPIWLTEFGINDPQQTGEAKGRAYAQLLAQQAGRLVGATYYHLNTKLDIDPQYHIGPQGDAALGSGLRI
jgi:hypothetical protein